jgi:hypothetical protein
MRGRLRCSRCARLVNAVLFSHVVLIYLAPAIPPGPFVCTRAAGPNRPSSGARRQAGASRKGEVHLSAGRARSDLQRFIGNIERECFILRIQSDVGHSVRCHAYISGWAGLDWVNRTAGVDGAK